MALGSRGSERLIVFVKAPIPGKVKTRLASKLGDQAACEAYETLVSHLFRQLRGLSNVTLCFAPDDAASKIEPWLQPGWNARPQGDGDLGARLARTIHEAFDAGASKVIAIGSDCPYISQTDIKIGWRKLGSCDVLVGPATDGGYWLIGLNAARPQLFADIPWSTDQVLGETLRKCKESSLRIDLLGILEDVDDLGSWQRFLAESGAALRK